MDKPFVSIVIPCYNENAYIQRCLDSLVCQTYPLERLEIIIADGMSQDGTRDIVKGYLQKYSFIKMLDNVQRITPCALNIGIQQASGEVVIRMDMHAVYEPHYVERCVHYLTQTGADNVGGAIVTHPKTDSLLGEAITTVLSHPFGVGGSRFRIGTQKQEWVDTVFGGCFWKSVFEKVGLYNENLSSSQDVELNARIRKAGGRILLSPDIISHYYTRSDLFSFLRNNYRNGFWSIVPFAFTKVFPVSIRHLVPLFFVLGLLGSFCLGMLWSVFFWFFAVIVLSYLTLNIYFSISTASKKKKWQLGFLLSFTFVCLHLSYGIGSLCGVGKLLLIKLFPKRKR